MPKIVGKQNRADTPILAQVSEADQGEMTVKLAFSSEFPYQKDFGLEILDHKPESVRLERLNGGAAVLVNHNSDDQVGVVKSATVDNDGVGRAVVKFSRSNRGQEIFQDVQDGIRQLVSVGYRIHKYEVTEKEDTLDEVRVVDWEPYELSIVSIPADPSVGVGRGENLIEPKTKPNLEEKKMSEETKNEVKFDAQAETKKIRTAETRRIDAIKSLCDAHGLDEMSRQAISEGWDLEKAQQEALTIVGKRNNAAKSNMSEEVTVDVTEKEKRSFSFVKLMDAMANPNDRAAQKRAAFELEVCADAEAQMPSGFNARGAYIPANLFERALSAGTATDGAELVATNLLAGSYIEVLRNNMVAMEAGVQLLPGLVGNVDIPRQTSGAAAAWISAEDGDAAQSDPQFDTISLTPKDLAAYTEVTRRLIQQSTPSIEALVRNDLFKAIALGLDSAVYYGSGASGQPQGIDGATGVDDPTFSVATAPTYAEMRTQMKTIITSNAASNLTYIISPDTWEQLGITPKQASGVEGNFVLNEMMGSILGRPYLVSSQLAADDFVLGDFSQMLMGEWGGVELNVDPYTNSLKGRTRYIIFKTVDLAIRHPEAFSFHNAA